MSRATAAELSEALAETFGHRFAHPELLREALTHPSASAPGSGKSARAHPARLRGYERLEFLGDRVLGLVVADLLYNAFPQEDEGALAKRLAVLASEDSLARVAAAANLGAHVVLSKAESLAGGRKNPALLADACEAAIGALYLDGGLAAAAAFIGRFWRPLMTAEAKPPQDAKTALQEWAQGAALPLPVYRTVRTEGPAHEPLFVVEVGVQGQPVVTATGRTKRTAEQAAAAQMLETLKDR
ncbi:MAG: ribonuclease III [Dongiaceae bacterium]